MCSSILSLKRKLISSMIYGLIEPIGRSEPNRTAQHLWFRIESFECARRGPIEPLTHAARRVHEDPSWTLRPRSRGSGPPIHSQHRHSDVLRVSVHNSQGNSLNGIRLRRSDRSSTTTTEEWHHHHRQQQADSWDMIPFWISHVDSKTQVFEKALRLHNHGGAARNTSLGSKGQFWINDASSRSELRVPTADSSQRMPTRTSQRLALAIMRRRGDPQLIGATAHLISVSNLRE